MALLQRISKKVFLDQQTRQEFHDRLAHRDIYLLNRPDRIRHLTLHLSKYVGRIAEGAESLRESAVVDGFLITLSLANAAGIDLQSLKRPSYSDREEITVSDWAIPVGQLAKVCESHDHMESIQYHEIMRAACAQLFGILEREAALSGVELIAAANQRRAEIQSKVPDFVKNSFS